MDPINTMVEPDFIHLYLIPWAIRLSIAAIIFILGRWVAKAITNTVRRIMQKGGTDEILANFTGNILYFALLAIVGIAALDHLGIQTTSLLALLGAAGLAIGLALKDSLSNFSSGVMLILFRPFNVGHFIEAAGVSGVVKKVTVFSTILCTVDNREIIVPNSHIYGGTIVNVSAHPTRRIDMVFGIGYGDDLGKAKSLIDEIIKQDDRILTDPAPAIALGELADSSVNINVRPWVKSGDYWTVRSDLLEQIKTSFDTNGINIPYPQSDVHLFEVNSKTA